MIIRNKRYFTKPLKYGNKSCVCRQNHWHQSIIEAHYCDQLELLRKAKEIKSYEIQKKFELKVKGEKICSIIVDFLVTGFSGKEVHEVKSYITMTPVWNVKRKLFEALYPKIPYIVIK